jgi:hypothetical protein
LQGALVPSSQKNKENSSIRPSSIIPTFLLSILTLSVVITV